MTFADADGTILLIKASVPIRECLNVDSDADANPSLLNGFIDIVAFPVSSDGFQIRRSCCGN